MREGNVGQQDHMIKYLCRNLQLCETSYNYREGHVTTKLKVQPRANVWPLRGWTQLMLYNVFSKLTQRS